MSSTTTTFASGAFTTATGEQRSYQVNDWGNLTWKDASGATVTNDPDLLELETPEKFDDPRLKAEHEEFMTRRKDESESTNQRRDEYLRLWEKNYYENRPYQWEGQRRWQGRDNEDMRLVRIMFVDRFVERLAGVGVHAWLNDWSKAGRIGLNMRVPGEKPGEWEDQTVATLQYPYAPEYTIMRFDEYDVPTREKYHGWRTTLLKMIMVNLITEEQALEAFGEALGPASLHYREQLFNHRNRGMHWVWPAKAVPLHEEILVTWKPQSADKKGHIIMVRDVQEENYLEDGKVLAVGRRYAGAIRKGDTVYFPRFAGRLFYTGNNKRALMLKPRELAAVQGKK